MPNSQNIDRYPVLLFDAFGRAREEDPVTLHATSPYAAKNLRSLCYTLRGLLRASSEGWHQELYRAVQHRKFYIDGSALLIASPMLLAQRSATLESIPTPNA
jgi:hypothetical protein